MTKSELIAAIVGAPDNAHVYLDVKDGILRTLTQVYLDEESPGEHEIILTFDE